MTCFRTKNKQSLCSVYLTFNQYKLSNNDENQNYLKIIKIPPQVQIFKESFHCYLAKSSILQDSFYRAYSGKRIRKSFFFSLGNFIFARRFRNSQNSIFTLKFKFIERGNLKHKAVILFFFSLNHFLFSWNHLHTINTRQSINCSIHLQQQRVCASHDYYINETNGQLSFLIFPTNPRCRCF